MLSCDIYYLKALCFVFGEQIFQEFSQRLLFPALKQRRPFVELCDQECSKTVFYAAKLSDWKLSHVQLLVESQLTTHDHVCSFQVLFIS